MSPIFVNTGQTVVWRVLLDPQVIRPDRVELSLSDGAIAIDQAGIDWGDAVIQAFMSDNRVGSTPIDYRLPNRMVVIPLFVGVDDSGEDGFWRAKDALMQKVALFQREGGVLQRGFSNPMYADIVDATLTFPDVWSETAHLEPNVKLTLECVPDFYGPEVQLDPISTTDGYISDVLRVGGQPAIIQGDHPGRVRITVNEDDSRMRKGALWGWRSRYYDQSSTAHLLYQAQDLTPLNGAKVVSDTNALGGTCLTLQNLPGSYHWAGVVTTDVGNLASSKMSHVGSYRVRCRAKSTAATPKLRFLWGVGDVAHPVTNAEVQLPGAGDWYEMDLGEIHVSAPPIGSKAWAGVIQVATATTGDDVLIDTLTFQPLDEGSGLVAATTVIVPQFGISVKAYPTNSLMTDTSGGVDEVWMDPTKVRGPAPDGQVAAFENVAGAPVRHSQYLTMNNFGFQLPTGASIMGIQADLYRADGFAAGGPGQVWDDFVGLNQNSNTPGGGTNNAWPAPWSGNVFTYGGPSDLWGRDWSAADINSVYFGLAVRARIVGFDPTTPYTYAWVDGCVVTVYYTVSGGLQVIEDAVCYAGHTMELRTEGMYRQSSNSSTIYGPIGKVLGDLPRIPPSGLEARQVELFMKMSESDLSTTPDNSQAGFTATVSYSPSWIFPP